MKVVVLFDLAEPPPENQDFRSYEKNNPDWWNETDVKQALQRIGHEALYVGVFDDLPRLIEELEEIKPDLVFNMCQSFRNNRYHEPRIAGVLELLQIPYTGTKSLGLGICQNKTLAKKIMKHHKIHVPTWITSRIRRPIETIKDFRFPAFIKPEGQEGSEGISKDAFADNEKDCLDRIRYLHDKFKSDVLIEEFIEGREFYASVLGGKRIKVFPLRELTFESYPEGEPRFATYHAKWDQAYRKRWGIRNQMAKDIPPPIEKQIHSVIKKAFHILHLSGYARFDLRVTSDEKVYILEANPNPSITEEDDYAVSAKKAGMKYDKLIRKIVELGLSSPSI